MGKSLDYKGFDLKKGHKLAPIYMKSFEIAPQGPKPNDKRRQ